MSTYNKDGPLTPKRLARIKRQIAGAHSLGGPAYADCRGILGRAVSGRKPGFTYKRKLEPAQIEERLKERAQWWQARGA